jgi:hypothetical protein
MTQMDLFSPKAPRVSDEDVENLLLELDNAEEDGWIPAHDLARFPTETEHRKVRAIAERAGGQVISGQRGYKLTRRATVEECDTAERWLRSQARKMLKRALAIRRVRNGRTA